MDDDDTRWRGRPALARAVRAVAYLVPIVASVIAGAVVSRALPVASGFGEAVAWWFVVLAASGIVVLVVERLARRLLPLSALLGLSLAFPDQAPSRFRVAVRAGGTRHLEERVNAARDGGADGEPRAAAAILELATLLNTHDRRTRGHCERVRVFADLLGEELQLPDEDRDRLRWAALLHDIGKLSVPADILNKPGKPNPDEWAVLQSHPDESERFLAPVQSWLGPWTLAASQHHERWDGTGYPTGLAGHDIAYAARIVAVADSYEVMTATRAYKRPMSAAAARAELARCAGAQFDPVVVRAFLNISLGRLRIAAGPLAWLAQIPFLGQLPRLATGGATLPNVAVAAQSGVASTAMAVGATVGMVVPTHSPPAPPVAVEDTTVAESPGAPAPVHDVVVTATTTIAITPTTAPPPTTTTSTTTPARPAPGRGPAVAPSSRAPEHPARPEHPATSARPEPTTTTTTTAPPTTTTAPPPVVVVVDTTIPRPPVPVDDRDDDENDDDNSGPGGGGGGGGGGGNSGPGGGDDDEEDDD